MASETLRGRTIPLRVADHVGLELCNTRAGWGESRPKEYLLDYETFLVWANAADVIRSTEFDRLGAEAEQDPVGADRVLTDVLSFRDQLYSALTDPAQDMTPLERWFKRAVRESSLTPSPSGGWDWDGGAGLAMPARRLVLSTATLLSEHSVASVHRCAGAGCGWLFLDRSGRRRWCVMAVCGNRAKARRHSARVRA